MKQAFRLIFEKLRFCYLVTIGAFKLLFYPDSYLHRVGFFYSVGQHKPLNLKREPVPWMNYNAISFLETRLSKSIKIFEYGSGYSTVFYADRASQVTSLEYNKEWLNKIQEMLSGRDNVRLLYKPLEYDGEYCKAILSTREKFDLVIVDGRDRVRCIFNAVDALTSSGVIILDDSSRKYYEEGTAFLVAQGFRRLDFEGLKPSNYGLDMTSIFYRDNNCLNI